MIWHSALRPLLVPVVGVFVLWNGVRAQPPDVPADTVRPRVEVGVEQRADSGLTADSTAQRMMDGSVSRDSMVHRDRPARGSVDSPAVRDSNAHRPIDSTVGKREEGAVLLGIEASAWPSSQAFSGRFTSGFSIGILELAPLTISMIRSPDGHTRFSMNPLLLLAASLAAVGGGVHGSGSLQFMHVFALLALPQMLGNVGVQIPIVPWSASLVAGFRTDYYLFNSPARVYLEGSAGIALRFAMLRGDVRFTWPITQGYLESKRPFVGINAYLTFPVK